MTRIKYFTTSILGLSCAGVGIWLRLAAHELAWPIQWAYSGAREDTSWAIREHAYQDVGLAILGFGLLIIILVLANWLWAPSATGKPER